MLNWKVIPDLLFLSHMRQELLLKKQKMSLIFPCFNRLCVI